MNQKYYLTGTKTAENLAKAFARESQGRNLYLFYSEVAKKEGYPTLERIFLETADNERGHGEAFYKYLTSGSPETVLEQQVSVLAALETTKENLMSSIKGEHMEWTEVYPGYGREAEREGFSEIAESFFKIATIEKRHEERYAYLLGRIKKNMLFELPYETTWVCTNCGLHFTGKSAPDFCPACQHPQKYFMNIFDELYPVDKP